MNLRSYSYIISILLSPNNRYNKPHARIMFLIVTRPSVSQSVSPVFLVIATPLKPLKRISWNFVVMKDIMCRCAYPQEILIQFVFLGVTPFLNLEIWLKWKILLKQFVNPTTLKLLNRISWNFVVVKVIPCTCAYPGEILVLFFFNCSYTLFRSPA